MSFESPEISMESTGSWKKINTRLYLTQNSPDLMAIEREEKLERVLVKYFYCGVQQCNRQQLSIGTVSHRENIIRHFQCTHMDQGKESSTMRLCDWASACT